MISTDDVLVLVSSISARCRFQVLMCLYHITAGLVLHEAQNSMCHSVITDDK